MNAVDTTTHIVLVGAARSGTKIMRDTLAAATGAGAVPYDIGFIWRVGDPNSADDVLEPASVTAGTRRFVRQYVGRYAAGAPPAVIEKTVGNTLRIPFVREVLPEARYLHLVRDGVDVVESTWRQWREPSDYRYLVAKLKHFPLRMIPTYGRRYVTSVLRRRVSSDRRVATWGPRYPDIDRDLASTDLLTVCCRQWRDSVRFARRDLAVTGVPSLEVRYEDLISDPRGVLEAAAAFCELPTSADRLDRAVDMLVPGRAGAGARALRPEQLATVDREIGELLDELGYQRPISDTREERSTDDR